MKTFAYLFVVWCLIAAASAAFAATAYTDAAAFNTAVAEQGLNFVLNLDSQAAGSSADQFGMVAIISDGLQSDGLSRSAILPVITSNFSTSSGSKSIGGSGSEDQFLAGNGDNIVFNLSHPVNAFGMRLIGNPSPTGEPAIPFWRMHVNVGSGFDAYSATEPSQTLSLGNDVYFLGVVSDTTFNQVELYSDNDLAAVFSFNIDDIAVAANVEKLTLAQVKSSTPKAVVVSGPVVTRLHSDRFNVENVDRDDGLAVLGAGATKGKEVSFFGDVQTTPDGEQVINLIHLISEQDPPKIPGSLGMGCRSVGGGVSEGLQIGCTGSNGPNNIGLDVVIWGRISAIAEDNSWMTVNDGSERESGMGSEGVKVVGAINAEGRHYGDFVKIHGSSSLFLSGEDHYPVVKVAESTDIE